MPQGAFCGDSGRLAPILRQSLFASTTSNSRNLSEPWECHTTHNGWHNTTFLSACQLFFVRNFLSGDYFVAVLPRKSLPTTENDTRQVSAGFTFCFRGRFCAASAEIIFLRKSGVRRRRFRKNCRVAYFCWAFLIRGTPFLPSLRQPHPLWTETAFGLDVLRIQTCRNQRNHLYKTRPHPHCIRCASNSPSPAAKPQLFFLPRP